MSNAPLATGATMKIAVGQKIGDYSEEGMLEWQDAKVPEVKDDLVQIKVHAVALNRIDLLKAKGASLQGLNMPLKPMSDVSGIVTVVGPKVKSFKTGDEVVTCVYPGNECLAEYITAPENTVGKKPARWTHSEGAALCMTAVTASTTIKKAGELNNSSEVVLLGASGGVGSMILGLNRSIGAPILAVASASKHSFVKAVGGPTVQVLDYKKEDWTQRYKDKKPYAVIDVSSVSPSDSYYQACRVGAKKFLTTNPLDPTYMFSLSCCCTECCFLGKAYCGSLFCCRPAYTIVMMSNKDAIDVFNECAELAEKGDLKPPPVKVFPPKQVHMAYGMMKDQSGKAVIDMSKGV